MNLKGALLGAAMTAWTVLVVGGTIAVYNGMAAPYLSPSDIPGGSAAAFGGMLVLVGAGLVVVKFLDDRQKRDQWREAGRQAGLRPSSDGNPPNLTGTVDGRPVTARLVEHRVGGGNRARSTVRHTYVETELAGPAEDGVIVGGDWGEIDADRGSIEFDSMVENGDAVDGLAVVEAGDLSAVGTSSGAARAAAAGRAQDAVRSLDGLNLVYVGDASRAVATYAEAQNEDLEGSVFEFPVDDLVEAVPADAATVSIETLAWIRDGDELRRHAEAVVAIADAVEETTGRTASRE